MKKDQTPTAVIEEVAEKPVEEPQAQATTRAERRRAVRASRKDAKRAHAATERKMQKAMGKPIGRPFEIVDSVKTFDGVIVDLSNHLDALDVTNETIAHVENTANRKDSTIGKVQAYMMKVSQLIYNFIADYTESLGRRELYSVKITGDGFNYILMICNGETKTIAGRTWTYQDFFTNLGSMKGHELEILMNGVVKLIIDTCDKEKPLEKGVRWV